MRSMSSVSMDGTPTAESLFPEAVETPRLRLERLRAEAVSLRELHEMRGLEAARTDATEYVLWEPDKTLRETREFVRTAERDWETGEKARYVIRPRDGEDGAGDLAGTTTLTVAWERRVGIFGVFLRKRFWGRGYAGERANALLAIAFDSLGLEAVEASCAVGNERSRRAIEKYVDEHGGRYVGVVPNFAVTDAGEPLDSHHFAVTREDYQN